MLGASVPDDCSGHLSQHCVTGSVARCVPRTPGGQCQSEVTCVFGSEWWSIDSSHLVIAGTCSDGDARPILIEMNNDASSNTTFGGAGGRLLSVAGEPGWTHDNWEWAFRKCPSDATSCSVF